MITLALELAEKFKDVMVFESGATSSEMETQSLYDGKLLGHKQPSLQTSRLRFLGGSTNHWEGLCAPLDPVDFERLPDRPYSGWPFELAALTPFYDRAYRYCEIDTIKQDTPNGDPIVERLAEGPELRLAEFGFSPPPPSLVSGFGPSLMTPIGLRSTSMPTSPILWRWRASGRSHPSTCGP
jgi:choline dehydrogenase-like flavoprotein